MKSKRVVGLSILSRGHGVWYTYFSLTSLHVAGGNSFLDSWRWILHFFPAFEVEGDLMYVFLLMSIFLERPLIDAGALSFSPIFSFFVVWGAI